MFDSILIIGVPIIEHRVNAALREGSMARARTIDLFSQINGGQQFTDGEREAMFRPESRGVSPTEVLVLGQSHRDEVFKFCGLRANQMRWHQRGALDFPDAENWPYAQTGVLYLFFDAQMRWQGLNWEPGPKDQSLVSWAAVKDDGPRDDEGVLAGRLRLLINGGGIRHHAILPDFISSLSGRGLQFTLKAMAYDKWIKLHTQGSGGTLTAEFTLRTLKSDRESRFEIDYCLTSLTLLAPALAQWAA